MSHSPQPEPRFDNLRRYWGGLPRPELTRSHALDAIPGCGVLLALLVGALGAIVVPKMTIYAAGIIALYLALRTLLLGIASVRGLRAVAQAEGTDWRRCVAQDADALPWASIRHVVIIPNYNEPEDLLAATLTHLAAVELAREKLIVVLAMEAAEADSAAKGARLQARFADQFAGLQVTVHPVGLPGEMQCKSANLAWAGRWLQREFGDNADAMTVTAMDADTVWHPAYFSALTAAFATDPARYQRMWQAPIRYHGEIYTIHPAMRPLNAYSTATELAYLSADWWLTLPISSYSVSLRLLMAVDHWDTAVIADEWHMYIKAFARQQGDFAIMPIYLPFIARATGGASLWQTVTNRYRQSLRHAWGSKEVGYAVAQMTVAPAMLLARKIRLIVSVAHDVTIAGAGWVFITAGSQLPLLFHADLRAAMFDRGLIYPQTFLLELAGVILAVLGLVFLWIDARTRPPRPAPMTRAERGWSVLAVVLLPVFAVLFVTLPILHAQMMLLFGRSLPFEVTEK